METVTVSMSEISAAQTCPQMWMYSYYFGYRPKQLTTAIKTGSAGHKMLENFFKHFADHRDIDGALDHMYHSITEEIDSSIFKAYQLARAYIIEDFSKRAKHFESLHVEKKFFVPIDDSLIIAFTPDVTYVLYGNIIVNKDYKFVGKKWPAKKMEHYKQLDGYDSLLRMAGVNVDSSILLFFNTETYKYYQVPRPSNPKRLEIVKKDLIKAAHKVAAIKRVPPEEIRDYVERTFQYQTCQYCLFSVPCGLELNGKTAEKTFKYEYTQNHGYGYTVANN